MKTIALYSIILFLLPFNLLVSWESIPLGQDLTGRIKGSVRNEKGEPLVGVKIVIVGSTIGAVSDKRGEYEITRVPPGSYSDDRHDGWLQVRHETDVIVRSGIVQEVNFKLEETVIEIPAIDVLGERQRQQQSDVRSSLHFLETRSAKTIPGFWEDVLRSLQALPGIVAPSDFSAQLHSC